MEGQHSEYIFQPHPESPFWNDDLNRYITTRLDEVAQLDKSERELVQPVLKLHPGRTAERVLYNRLVNLMSEEISHWDNETLREEYEQVEIAFGILAFSRFNRFEQGIFINRLGDSRELWEKEGKKRIGIELSPQQAQLLKTIAQRIGLPYDETQTYFPFSTVDDNTPKRITEIEDPQVSELLSEQAEDKIGNILKNIGALTYKQKVMLLLQLSKEELEEFKQRRREGFKDLAEDITPDKELFLKPEERIRIRSRLAHTTPRYEIAAELRRRYIESGENYPATMDIEFEKDKPTTSE